MEALLVVDVQNEFSPTGRRPVADHGSIIAAIQVRVDEARREKRPIAWIRHHNRPHESPAFQPGSWGAELSPGMGPSGGDNEKEFVKDVFGAFTGTGLEGWLHSTRAEAVLIVGFYAHMCVATSAREALVRGFAVTLDPDCTGACDVRHEALGLQQAEEVRRSALLHLAHMGAEISIRSRPSPRAASAPPEVSLRR